MTKDEFKLIAAGLRSVYRKDKLLDTPEAFNIWYELLKDLDYQKVSEATQVYMMHEHFPPVPADIRKKVFELTNIGTELSEGEAWGMVRQAISRSSYGYAYEFSMLPEDIQKAVGTDKQLQIWARDENFQESVVQSQFLRSYRIVKDRADKIRVLPERYQALLIETAGRLGIPEMGD